MSIDLEAIKNLIDMEHSSSSPDNCPCCVVLLASGKRHLKDLVEEVERLQNYIDNLPTAADE